ncbi:MAG: hypothetical protein HN370_06755, partial [Phycisphaerales bacterium]|nr:hypothetical protein [Phycisphaerales bacterium]
MTDYMEMNAEIRELIKSRFPKVALEEFGQYLLQDVPKDSALYMDSGEWLQLYGSLLQDNVDFLESNAYSFAFLAGVCHFSVADGGPVTLMWGLCKFFSVNLLVCHRWLV